MTDMIIKLYDVEQKNFDNELAKNGITIKRALSPDKSRITDFIKKNFSVGWANECDYALHNNPISCFIAVKNKEIIGFACYDATARGMFGPVGVRTDVQKSGIGKALLHKCLNAMKEMGYAYAIVGWVDTALDFYKKEVNAIEIPGSSAEKSIYSNLIDID